MTYFGRWALMAVLTVSATSALAQNVTVNFAGTERPESFKEVIAAFEQRHPDVKVAYEQIPFANSNAQIEARVGSRDPGMGVYMVDTPRIPTFASRQFLVSLDKFRPRVEKVVSPSELKSLTHDDKLYAFPFWTGTQIVLYNRDLLDKAGVAYPSDDPNKAMTWEELIELARQVQHKAGVRYGFTFAQPDRYYQMQPLFESAGAGSGLQGDNLLTPNVENAGWVKTGKWYQSLFDTGLSPRGIASEQTNDLFGNGDVVFLYGGLPILNRLKKFPTLKFGVTAVPYFAGGKNVSPTGSFAIGVSPYAKNLEQAVEFARFLTIDPDGVKIAQKAGVSIPASKEVYGLYIDGLKAQTKHIGRVADIVTYQLENTAVPRPRSIGYVPFEEIMNRTFSDIRNGADVADELKRAQDKLTKALSRLKQ